MSTPMFFGDHSGRISPLTGRPLISYPAAGTRCISILPRAPTNRIFASGRFAFMAFAIDTAGNIWPPVPPPLITILSSLSIVPKFCFFVTSSAVDMLSCGCLFLYQPLPVVFTFFLLYDLCRSFSSLLMLLSVLLWECAPFRSSSLPTGSRSVSFRYTRSSL